MALDNIQLEFSNDFVGKMISPTGTVLIGDQPNGIQPYHLLFGALGSCFYSTFLAIATKKRLTFGSVKVEVSGQKRSGEVQTLEWVNIKVSITNPSNEALLTRSAELGTRFCSIHNTIAHVAEMHLEVLFI
ncbi:MAG: OsmC family protein [Firmicutes bacterium]|nr:OsmC family protein [Bacillota bacterium]